MGKNIFGLILIGIFIITFSINFVSSENWCFQEQTNQVSTTDGGCYQNYNGTYGYDAGWTTPALSYDKDYSTYGSYTDPGTDLSYAIYMNYTKPTGGAASNESYWYVKAGNGIQTEILTPSFFSDCWEADPNVLYLKTYINFSGYSPPASPHSAPLYLACRNNLTANTWRVLDIASGTGNNDVVTLYEEGIYWSIAFDSGTSNITFNVQEVTGGPISDVFVQAKRMNNGTLINTDSGTTDYLGQVSLSLNRNFTQYLTFTKDNYETLFNKSFALIQDTYTVTMLGSFSNLTYNNTLDGVSYEWFPKGGAFCYQNNTQFSFYINSTFCNLQNSTMIIHYINGTILAINSSNSSCGGNITLTLNTSDGQILLGSYYTKIANVTYKLDPARWTMLCVEQGSLSVKSFFENLRGYETGDIKKQYVVMFWFWLIFFLIIGMICFTFGVDALNPGIVPIFALIIVGMASYSGFLNIDLVVNNSSPYVTYLNNWAVFVVILCLSLGYLFGRIRDS